MDKHRKAVVELCAAIELADIGVESDDGQLDYWAINQKDWRILKKLVDIIKASFNHSMQFHYEQHLKRESKLRGVIAQEEPQKEGDQ